MMILSKMYYCYKCNKKHRCGKIYQEHFQFKQEEEQVESKKIMDHDLSGMRVIARRQINVYKKRMKQDPRTREMYVQAINKVILHEENR